MTGHHVSAVRLHRHHDFTSTVASPALSWVSVAADGGWHQSWAEIADGTGAVHRIDGRSSVAVPWPFAPLVAGERRRIAVRTAAQTGEVSAWSAEHEVRAGFLADGGWTASFVRVADPTAPGQPALLRHEFEIDGDPVEAILDVTALGAHVTTINGAPINDHVLAPGWTSYDKRVPFESIDVTNLVTVGGNAIGVKLGGAWRTEEYGFFGAPDRVYGDQPSYAASLRLIFADGTTRVITTDEEWLSCIDGEIVESSIYQGERVDAVRRRVSWDRVGADLKGWSAVALERPDIAVDLKLAPPVRCTQEIPVAEVLTTPSGKTVLDFGQNLVGRLRFTVEGQAGTEIVLRHVEVLEHGEICTRPLGRAAATDAFVLAGGGDETFEPQFTFHGFRYVQVDGWPGKIDPTAFMARVLHSDMVRTGSFSSSSDLVNRLHENVVWSMRGNFLSIPTDCPQRAERMGWTGDIQVFAPAAATLFDVDGFLADWLRDVALEQDKHDGLVPFVIPDVLGDAVKPAAAWGDAATVVPWALWERYADVTTLADQFPSMRKWADRIIERAGGAGLWEGSMQFGDWLDPDAPPSEPGAAKCSRDIVATAYVVRSARIVAQASKVLGEHTIAADYRREADRIADAFRAAYMTPSGRMMSDAPTAYALAIAFDIAVDPQLRQALGDRLAERVRASGFRVSTGFVGTPIILDALTATGHVDTAAKLLTSTDNPSWLYPVSMGATTIWERWDSLLPDGSVNPGEMTSFNHYALGAVIDWLHSSLAGLAPAEPGWARITVNPTPIAELDHARSEQITPFGPAAAGWRREGSEIIVEVVIPPNTTAEVVLPWEEEAFTVGSGAYAYRGESARRASSGSSELSDAADLSITSPLALIAEDPEAFATVRRVLTDFSPGYTAAFFSRTEWTMGAAPGDVMFGVPPRVMAELDEALRALATE